MHRLYTIFIVMFFYVPCWAQQTKMELVKQGMDYIYNFEFDRAQSIIETLETSNNPSAIPELMKALQVFWQYYPIHFHEAELESYYDYLMQAYSKSMKVLDKEPENYEAQFLAMASQGLLAESYAESGSSFKAVGAAKKAYNYMKAGADNLKQYSEFYVSTGLYNYYREYYPETYPIYKPFMYFFMKGDKGLGIQQLEIASSDASISHVIAKYYLSYIYMRYEYIPTKALEQGKNLHEEYPNNDLFTAIYLESLIINDSYHQATAIARKLQRNSNSYFRVYGDVFMGVIQEKQQQNFKLAEKLYRKALDINDSNDMNMAHLEAIAYLGLGRIYRDQNDPRAEEFFKESRDRAYTKTLKNEAKSYLTKQ